jgi:peptidoglycan/LPS O-acetylase OafA/YrhL
MLHQAVVQIALLTVGAYLLFWFAFIPSPLLGKFRSFPDISYGVYLYGWPTQELLIWYIPTISPWVMFPLALGICSVCGLLSWHLVENPFLKLKPKPERKDSDLPQGTASDRPSFTTTV